VKQEGNASTQYAEKRKAGSGMLPQPAQYLLRCDDLCPTMNSGRWQRFVSLIDEFQIYPILAVVPDNQDPDLRCSPPAPAFWEQMRAMESSGASIALHGYRHVCVSRGRSFLRLHDWSEFAGVEKEAQRAWIREGLRILHSHGLHPRIWVAPRHGFDVSTLHALQEEEITLLSDGFARVPFMRDGVTWIPQQLWAPVRKEKGLWTLCVHANTTTDAQIEELRTFLGRYAAQFTSVDRVLAEFQPGQLNLVERGYETLALWRIWASKARKHLLRKRGKSGSC
jgi:predicted deacetylase